MKKCLAALCLLLFSLAAGAPAIVPTLSLPRTLEVEGSGLHPLVVLVSQSEVSPEVQRSLRYSLAGLPPDNPPRFDENSQLLFWRPEPHQAGRHDFSLTVKDPLGNTETAPLTVLVAPGRSLEALPKGWEEFKLIDKYLLGRRLFPAADSLWARIAARPDYQLEVRVRDSMDEECVLTYLPGAGSDQASKTSKTATIMLGGEYGGGSVRWVRRDLYEDLFDSLDLVLKRVESISVRGDFLLESVQLTDRPSLVSSLGADNLLLPRPALSFDDRYYEPNLYSQQEPIQISDTPAIKVEFNAPSGVIWRLATLTINEKTYHAAWGEFSLVVIKPARSVSPFDADHAMYLLKLSSAQKMPFGEHRLLFSAENAYGQAVSLEAFARVVTVPTQLEGSPMVFPSPFNPERDREVRVQYRLSLPGNIEIIFFGGDGSIIAKKRFISGEEGGLKGLNTVVWDGRSDGGAALSNGIYIGVIIDKDENRILDRFRLTVFR